MRTVLILLFFGLCVFCKDSLGQINVNPGQNAASLAQKLAGQGVTILNPVLKCPTNANGFFTTVSSNIGLDSGIVLTNGQAETIGHVWGINGPGSELASTDNGAPGDDSALEALAGQKTYDACDLEFDIVPAGDTVRFNYFFSSEEYINSVCGRFNDAFAFFISGPGITGTDNMALVPGTQIPVTVNSINDGIVGSVGTWANCTGMGPGSPFTAYYVDNTHGTTLTHRGFTTVLQAVHEVTACGAYHLKIEIVDADDALYDSGVFLEAGSLQSSSYHVSAVAVAVRDTVSPICVKGCLPGTFQVKSSQVPSQPQTLKFLLQGSAVSGYDYAAIPDSVIIPAGSSTANVTITGLPTPVRGTKTIQLYLLSGNNCSTANNIIDSANMVIYDTPFVSITPADTFVCGLDSVSLFAASDSIYTLSWTPSYNISSTSAQDPTVFPAVNTDYTLTISLPGTPCPDKSATANFTIRVTPQIALTADTTLCYNSTFTPGAVILDPNPNYVYLWRGPSGYTSTELNPVVPINTTQQQVSYTLSVTNDTNGCKSAASIGVAVTIPDTPLVVNPEQFCLNTTQAQLTAQGENLTWYTSLNAASGSTIAPEIPVNFPETFTYYVTQTIGECESPKTAVAAVVEQCCNGNIFIPSAFAPNSTGINRTFNVFPDYGYFIKSFMIYNRWGQLVYDNNKAGWDGTYLDVPAEMGSYFYQVVFGCVLGGEAVRTGDVTLIR